MDYDVLIIGGGPGGSTVGTFLADAGRKVLLLEREQFPRYHIGESLISGTVTLFEKLGVLEQIEKAGHTKKYGITWIWGKDRLPWSVYFKDAVGIPHDYSFQVERGAFDKMLLDNACAHGVNVLERNSVTDLIWEGDRLAGVEYESAATGIKHRATARWVVDASGQSSFLSRQVSKRSWDTHLRNMAIWSYWEGAKRPEGIDRGNIFLPTFQEGWWWFIPLRRDITSVGAVIDRENYEKAQKQGLEAFYLDAIGRTPELAERLRPARRTDEIRVLRDWSYRFESFCGKGYFAVGDAACFIDPLLSTGVHLAMLSGYLAAVSLNTLLDGSVDEARVLAFYEDQYFREYSRFREKVYFLYGGHKAGPDSYFWQARKIFDRPTDDPKKSFVSLIAGAFEHRAWYRRFSRQLDLPNLVREHGDAVFPKKSSGESPSLKRVPGWETKEDLAIEGLALKPATVLVSPEGRNLPMDEILSAILEKVDGRVGGDQIVQEVAAGDESRRTLARSRLSEALAFGLLTG